MGEERSSARHEIAGGTYTCIATRAIKSAIQAPQIKQDVLAELERRLSCYKDFGALQLDKLITN